MKKLCIGILTVLCSLSLAACSSTTMDNGHDTNGRAGESGTETAMPTNDPVRNATGGENGEGAQDAAENVTSGVEEGAENAKNATEDVAEGAGQAAGDVVEGAGKAVQDAAEGAGQAVQDAAEGVGNVARDAADGVKNATE